jgi:hypothetical protein
MIADKLGILVDEVFNHPETYAGAYYLAAGIGYSIQLYADFSACTTISQGVSELFGIRLSDNFKRPYFATSIADFWRRWHISLSLWLRDYVYIPLGSNRKGRARKYLNVLLVFLVSGFWHGSGVRFLFWGLLHGVYQLTGGLTKPAKDAVYRTLQIPEHSLPWRILKTAGTWCWVMFAWIICRAASLRQGLTMIRSIFMVHNPWVLFDDSLLELGLSWKEWDVLLFSIAVLFGVSLWQERHESECHEQERLEQERHHKEHTPRETDAVPRDLRDVILSQHIMIRIGADLPAHPLPRSLERIECGRLCKRSAKGCGGAEGVFSNLSSLRKGRENPARGADEPGAFCFREER